MITAETKNENTSLINWRMESMETNLGEVKTDIREIKETLVRLTALIGDTNLAVLTQKNIEQAAKIEALQLKVDGINTTIIKWAAIAGVIVFLLGQVVIPYALNHVKLASTEQVSN